MHTDSSQTRCDCYVRLNVVYPTSFLLPNLILPVVMKLQVPEYLASYASRVILVNSLSCHPTIF